MSVVSVDAAVSTVAFSLLFVEVLWAESVLLSRGFESAVKLLFIKSWNVFCTAVFKIHLLLLSSLWHCFLAPSRSESTTCSSFLSVCLRGFGGRPRFLAKVCSLLLFSALRGVRLSSSIVTGSFRNEKKSGSSSDRLGLLLLLLLILIGVVVDLGLRGFFEGFVVWIDGGVDNTELDFSIWNLIKGILLSYWWFYFRNN